MTGVAYSPEVPDNPNFVSRPPDPGLLRLYGTMGYEALYHSPFSGVYRSTALMLEKSPYFNVDGAELSADDANKRYGLGGQLKFDEPIKESAAQLMVSRKIEENNRSYAISSGMNTGFRRVAGLGVGMAATLLDPINTASMFIPIVGEAKFARMLHKFGGSMVKARAARGAIEGTVGMAMVEPFVLLPAMQEQANYSLEDSAINLAYGAVLGSFLHLGMGAIGDRIKRMKPREADAIFEAAMNNVLKDEPVVNPAKIVDFVEPPETIVSAAVRADDGTIHQGRVHGEAFNSANDAGKQVGANADDEGFVTSAGRYVTRDEAMKIAKAADQVSKDLPEGPTEALRGPVTGLVAEDLPRRLDTANFKSPTELAQEVYEQIPRRDAKGRFLSQKERIRLLHEKLNAERIGNESQGQNIHKNTQPNKPRLTLDDKGNASVHDRVANDITKEADDLEQSILRTAVDDAEAIDAAAVKQNKAKTDSLKTELDEIVKTEIGNPVKRQAGIEAAVNCIIKNLI